MEKPLCLASSHLSCWTCSRLGPSSVALCKSVGLRPATTGKGSVQLTQWPEPSISLPSIPHAKAAAGTARDDELIHFNPTL